MKTFLFSTLTLVVLAHPVLAADLPLKAPLRAPAAPIYGWDGFYLGGNVGYSWGKEDLGVIGFTVNGVSIPGADFAALRPKGTIAGGQAGFNWQAANWVFGIETDLQWSDEKDSLTSAGVVTSSSCFGDPNTPCALTGTGTGTLATKIDWFGTLRGRLGVAADQFLFYGTGGLAYGRVRNSGAASFTGTFTDTNVLSPGPCDVSGAGCPASGSTAFADAKTRVGWTVGAGVEGAVPFIGNWSWRAEYLFVNLGTITTTTAYNSSVSIPAIPLTQTVSATLAHSARVTDNIVRFGLNYRFSAEAPVVARY